MSAVYAKALRRAAERLGGIDKLRDHLRVPMRQLESWLAGSAPPPVEIFLEAVDVISSPPADTAAVQRARALRLQSGVLGDSLERTRQRAEAVRAAILATRGAVAKQRARVPAAAFLRTAFKPGDGRGMVDAALDAALEAGKAERGNLQLALPDGLHIVAQRGFQQPFLDFFSVVDHNGTACGAAAAHGRRIVVADVQSDPIFAATAAADILASAGVRAVQSTPLIGHAGELVGILSTHYEEPRPPGKEQLKRIDSIASRTTFWLEGGAA